MVDMVPNFDTSYAAIPPSTVPLYGGTVAVSAMTNVQLGVYLNSDVSGGKSGSAIGNGLRDRLLDGRSSSIQDHADRMYIKKQLALGQGG